MPGLDRPFSFFGEPLVSPAQLTDAERAEQLRVIARKLRTGAPLNSWQRSWLADAIERRLSDNVLLDVGLGLRPVQGSTRTPRNLLRLRERDHLLLELKTKAGSRARALRLLRGEQAPPAAFAPLLAALHRLGAPRSASAFTRAQRRVAPDSGPVRPRTLRGSRY